MNFKEYQLLTARTASNSDVLNRRINYTLGLAGESGEVVDYVKKVLYHGESLSRRKIAEELGDVLWYMARLAEDFDLDLGQVAEANIEKLKLRYPHGFSFQDSRERRDYEKKG